MPTIELDLKDLEKLARKKIPHTRPALDDLVMLVKGEVDALQGSALRLDLKDTNRPDLLSAEGIARELRARLGTEKGIPAYKTIKGKNEITIEKTVEKARPFIACGIARNIKITEPVLTQFIQLQEKIGTTFGRRRKETGIGLYDWDKMTPPLKYLGVKPAAVKFAPLSFETPMTLKEILEKHPKGMEFAHLVQDKEYYPLLVDAAGEVCSFPPIINSNHTGKVTSDTKNIFVEVTGHQWKTVNTALNVMLMALADRGAGIETLTVHFPRTPAYPKKSMVTPTFETETIELDLDFVRTWSGLHWTPKHVLALLEKSRMKGTLHGNKVHVTYPAYRQDVLHAVDVIEDLLISSGFNEIPLHYPALSVAGKENAHHQIERMVRDACTGMGMQEIMTFTLTSREKQETHMNMEPQHLVEIANPKSMNHHVLRARLIPEMLAFLAQNKNAAYPQRVFEIGRTIELNAAYENGVREHKKVCLALTKDACNYTEIKTHFETLAKLLQWNVHYHAHDTPYFIPGRSVELRAGNCEGVMGEIHPRILEKFGLEKPVVLVEMEVGE
ncbi:MAG: phenylalanine--tRNA ligase subunit beta [Candidatus Diapherotrites archaeon]|nr:phenylalanine--tRNA ligase subunit beta [Candidatus Diapherotrites archaeon]